MSGAARRPALHRRPAWTAAPLPLLAALVVAYLTVPLIAFVVRLARTPSGRLPAPGIGSALVVSAETASVATALIALTAVPLAYLLSRGRRRSSALLGIVVQLPIALPPLMSGILLLYLIGPYSTLGRLFGGRLTDDYIGIVLAQTFVAAPFAIVAARSAFAALDPALDDVAATLGHHRLARFARVAVPAAAPGIAAGLLLSWLRAFGEFGATVVLAYHPYSLPVFTYVQFGSTGLTATTLPVAASLGAALAVLVLAVAIPRLHRPHPAPVPLPAARIPTARAVAPLSFELSGRAGTFTVAVAHQGHSPRLGILGASGAGKSLTLRMLAGLATLDRGRILFDDADLSALPPADRGIGYLPQEASLLPHLPVWAQTTFGVGADASLAAYWIDRLQLTPLVNRRPEQLSGGQRRRVGLARALARDPRLMLLDEPMTGLDTPRRAELRSDLRRLQLDTGITSVVVTHDIEDAAMLADELLVLDHGRLVQSGRLADLLSHPASLDVAKLLGLPNINAGVVTAGDSVRSGRLDLAVDTVGLDPGAQVGWSVSPDAIRLDVSDQGHAATVADSIDRGSHLQLRLALHGGPEVTAHVPPGPQYRVGSHHHVELPPDRITVWPDRGSAGNGH
jgi:ABC-type sulfate/molybdate transport systems ATPase subunit/ABC-type sulfate transport system permease component